ncbi:MAG: hypothetical protein ACHQAQ_06800 [Hyphomicrobiales bacterium]
MPDIDIHVRAVARLTRAVVPALADTGLLDRLTEAQLAVFKAAVLPTPVLAQRYRGSARSC